MKRMISFLLIISLCCSFPVYGFAKTSFHEDSDAIAEAAESVLLLTCYDKKGNTTATGSGFLAIEDGIILTNYHVIDGVDSIMASTEDGIFFVIDDTLCYDIEQDIAILKTNAKTRLPLLILGDSDNIKKGSKVVAIGSPLGLLNIVSEGIYSGIFVDDNTRRILFSASISSGSSGGALFDENGKVIGITCATYTEGQNLNLAVPINDALALWNEYKTGKWNTIDQPSPTPVSTPGIMDQYQIQLNQMGGNNGTKVVYAAFGYPLPSYAVAPKKEGYIFKGYYSSSLKGYGTMYYDEDMNCVHNWDKNRDGKLFARWEKDNSLTSSFTITLDSAGGIFGSSSVQAVYGSPMPKAIAPYKEGFNFEGYYSLPSGYGTKYYDSKMNSVKNWDIKHDFTLHAYWERATFSKNDSVKDGYYIVGSSSNTFALLYNKMCKNLDIKNHPIPSPSLKGNPLSSGEYEKYTVIRDNDTYEYIGYLCTPGGGIEYIIRYWEGKHKRGQNIGMTVFYDTDGKYIGNIQFDFTNNESTSSSRSPYFMANQKNHHLE